MIKSTHRINAGLEIQVHKPTAVRIAVTREENRNGGS
jgi:hypothetical protein